MRFATGFESVRRGWPGLCLLLLAAPCRGAQVDTGCGLESVRMRFQEGEFQQALAGLEACPKAKEYTRLKGLIHHGWFKPDSAAHYLRIAYKDGFHDDEVLVGLAESLLWLKQTDKAEPLLEKVKDKKAPAYLKAMATRYEMKRDFPKALAMYDQAIPAEKRPYITLFRKAMLLSWMDRLDESIALYTRLIDDEKVPAPFRAKCRIRRAEAISWKKELEPAVAELREVIKLDPKNPDAKLQLGEILEWQGRFKEAKDQYRDVLVADPENPVAKQRLEKLLWVK